MSASASNAPHPSPRPSPPRGADPVALTHWLCTVPSPIGDERELCDLLIDRSRSWPGATTPKRVLNSFATSIPATAPSWSRAPEATALPDRAVPRIALVGHLDVVRTAHDGPPRIEGDRLFGPGAADMKSGIALMIAAAEDAAPSRGFELTLVFYSREEGPFAENELGPLLEAHPELAAQDLAICLEPSLNKLQLGCVGSIHASVTVRGKTAHSARPWQGENAIQKAWPLLRDLDARGFREAVIDDMPYRSVMSATLVRGGRGRNVVPDGCELNVNYRFLPGVSVEEAEAELIALVDGRADVAVTDRSPSALPHRGNPMVAKLIEAGVTSVESKQAWTDVARFSALGVPAVNWGPGDQSQAHQRNESTSIAAIHDGWALLRRFFALV